MKKEDIIFRGFVRQDSQFGEDYLQFNIPLPLPNNGVYSTQKMIPIHVSVPMICGEGNCTDQELIIRGSESVYLNVIKSFF